MWSNLEKEHFQVGRCFKTVSRRAEYWSLKSKHLIYSSPVILEPNAQPCNAIYQDSITFTVFPKFSVEKHPFFGKSTHYFELAFSVHVAQHVWVFFEFAEFLFVATISVKTFLYQALKPPFPPYGPLPPKQCWSCWMGSSGYSGSTLERGGGWC